jgi:hypothetical protein
MPKMGIHASSAVTVFVAVLASCLLLQTSVASAETPTPVTTEAATPPIPLGTIVPGGPESFVPTPAPVPGMVKLVFVGYALAPNRITPIEPARLIAHDQGPSCSYNFELSAEQTQTLFTKGELELELPARCGAVEVTYRAVANTPTTNCPSGEELCTREEVVSQSVFMALEGSNYLSGRDRGQPEGLPLGDDVLLPNTGAGAQQAPARGYAWLILPVLAAVYVGIVGLRARRR